MSDDNLMTEDTILEKSLVNKFFKNIKQSSVNNKCADCDKSSPIWVTTTYALFICSDCAARHREMGVIKSKVKSTLLDKWKVGELRRVFVGGNKNKYKLGDTRDVFVKYKNADFYIEDIDELVRKSVLEDKFDFLTYENNINQVVSQEIKEISLPKFGDDCVNEISRDDTSKNDLKKESKKKDTVKKKKEDVFVIKKKSTPTLSKNKKYEIEDESRLRFINK